MKNKAGLSRNPVAHHMHKSCRRLQSLLEGTIEGRQDLPSMVALDDLENASEGSDTQGKEAIELMFDSGCGEGVESNLETNELEE